MNTTSRCSLTLALVLTACTGEAQQPPAVTAAPNNPRLQHHEIKLDKLPRPYATQSASNPPSVVGRPKNAQLHLPPGFKVAPWAEGLDNPRNMALAPNGDVFVAETAAGRITILRDADSDGVIEKRFVFATDLNRPFGLAFHREHLYVGNTDAVVRFPYKSGQTSGGGEPQRIAPLPGGGHSTRNVIFNRDGSKLYVAVGSRSNVSDETDDPRRAAITEYNPDGSDRRTFASGLRNPVGLAWQPGTNKLWTAVNERDGLGDDLVPDYVTEVVPGAFYGWPFSYLGQNVDPRRIGEHPELVKRAIPPTVLMQAHTAALGLAFYDRTMFPEHYRGGAFVALHGSWNRTRRSGYSVVHIPFRDGKPTGGYDDFLVGFAPDPSRREVWGRPVGLLVLADGSLLMADDGGDLIWRITYSK